MRKPPKAILLIIELASLPETTVDNLLDMLRKADIDRLKRNAFHIIQAIPKKKHPSGLLKFAAVHHVIGSPFSVFSMIAFECITGDMEDEDARDVVVFMLKQEWLIRFPGSLFHACMHNKPKLAAALYAEGIRITHENWAAFLYDAEIEGVIQMVQLYLQIARPDRAELIAMRLAAKEGSPLLAFLDEHLRLVVCSEISSIKH